MTPAPTPSSGGSAGLGRHLADVELRLGLSMLARNFSVEHADDPADIREVMAFTMMPSTMPVRLKSVRPG